MLLPANAVLLVIDVQQGFLHPDWGPRNNPDAEADIAHLLHAWRAAERPVRHVHHASRSPSGRFHPGAEGHAPKPQAEPRAGEPVHVKSVNSAFIGTDLEAALRAQGEDTLVLVGLTTNHCVSTTALIFCKLGFRTFFVEDATAAFDRAGLNGRMRPAADVHAAALSDLADEFATVASTHEILEALRAPPSGVAAR